MTNEQIMQLHDATAVEILAYLATINLTDESSRRFLFTAMKTKAFKLIVAGETPNVIALFGYACDCMSRLDAAQ
jgi:hypothetical protein